MSHKRKRHTSSRQWTRIVQAVIVGLIAFLLITEFGWWWLTFLLFFSCGAGFKAYACDDDTAADKPKRDVIV